MAKRLVLNKHALFRDEEATQPNRGSTQKPLVERTMIWSEREACVKQVTQISTSACGATAVINVLVRISYCVGSTRGAVDHRLILVKYNLIRNIYFSWSLWSLGELSCNRLIEPTHFTDEQDKKYCNILKCAGTFNRSFSHNWTNAKALYFP